MKDNQELPSNTTSISEPHPSSVLVPTEGLPAPTASSDSNGDQESPLVLHRGAFRREVMPPKGNRSLQIERLVFPAYMNPETGLITLVTPIKPSVLANPELTTRGSDHSKAVAWCLKQGQEMRFCYQGQSRAFKHMNGMDYLHFLMAHSERAFHASDLVLLATGGTLSTRSMIVLRDEADGDPALYLRLRPAGPSRQFILDKRAREEYQQKLQDYERQIDQARKIGDTGIFARLNAEKQFVSKELRASKGLNGRPRAFSQGNAAEKNRQSICQALTRAYREISKAGGVFPQLAELLNTRILCHGCKYTFRPRSGDPLWITDASGLLTA